MKPKAICTLVILLMLTCGAALAQAPPGGFPGPGRGGPGGFGPPMGGPPPGMRGPGPEMLERLGLTDAQRAKLTQVRDAEMRQVIRIEADVRIAELDLERLLDAERIDARGVDGAAERIASLRGEMLKAHLASRIAIHDVLTADQRTRLRRMKESAASGERGPAPR